MVSAKLISVEHISTNISFSQINEGKRVMFHFIVDTLKPSDLIKMVTSPIIDKRAKSYYLGARHKHEEDKSFGNNSVRI